ncbi:TPA: hypothetical protein ACKN0F_001903 [Neisseria gonorrhoeae]|uniref:hypothetical protein n=1 Tax=Neisseria gonorrhoeae TaxID=485 RepID=UPI001C616260|nr:hypothetical protein [Neisseria gonorrhoeae]MDO6030899.1 hypothetical protein [Neisseria gonorrhoeae]
MACLNAAAGKEGRNGFPAFGGGVGGVVPDVRRHIFGKIDFNIRQLSEYLLKFRIFRTGTLGAYVQFVGMEFLGIWG